MIKGELFIIFIINCKISPSGQIQGQPGLHRPAQATWLNTASKKKNLKIRVGVWSNSKDWFLFLFLFSEREKSLKGFEQRTGMHFPGNLGREYHKPMYSWGSRWLWDQDRSEEHSALRTMTRLVTGQRPSAQDLGTEVAWMIPHPRKMLYREPLELLWQATSRTISTKTRKCVRESRWQMSPSTWRMLNSWVEARTSTGRGKMEEHFWSSGTPMNLIYWRLTLKTFSSHGSQ